MRRLIITAFALLLTLPAAGQALRGLRRADSLRSAGQIKAAILAYRDLLEQYPAGQIGRYNLACAYAVDKQPDAAFAQLDMMRSRGYSLNDALTDGDFVGLYGDPRWAALESELIRRMEKAEHFVMQDLGYAQRLWRMKATDQALYGEIAIAERREGGGSLLAKKLWAKKDSMNRRNQKELTELIRTKGFPRSSQLGREAAAAAFLVIQHADSSLQSRYLPELLRLCKSGDADWESYALMYDRLEMRRNRPQRYGSQVWRNPATGKQEFWKLEDPARLGAWRTEAGLPPMSEYAQMFGLSYP